MLHRMKRAIVIVFVFAVVVTVSVTLEPGSGDAYAEVGSIAAGEDVKYDKNGGVLASMGFDTSKMPKTYDADSTTNPYGSDVSTLSEVDEALFFDLSNEDSKTVLYGHNKKLNGSYDEFVSSPVMQSTAASFLEKNDYVNAVKLDITGDGRDSAVAVVYTHYNFRSSGTDGKVYMRIYDPATGRKTDAFEITDLLEEGRFYRATYDYQIQSMLEITAGDFDKDSVDEIAVYAPGKDFLEKNKVMFFDLTDGKDCDDPYSKDSWRHSWNYVLPDYSQDIVNIDPNTGTEYAANLYNNLDLTAGDADNDGIDDIIISYGASDTDYARAGKDGSQGIVRSIPSKSVLLYGNDDGQMLRNSQNISYGDNNLIRVSFAFGDVDEDGNEDMFIAGQLAGEQKENKSRVIGKYVYDKDSDKMSLESMQNMNVVEGTQTGSTFSSTNGWDENYYSAPLMKTNLAVGKIMGSNSNTKIYLDSVLYSYDNGNYAIEDELEDTSKDKKGNYKGSHVFGGEKAFKGNQRPYYEFGADICNLTAANTDYIMVNRVSTSDSLSGTQTDDVKAASSILIANDGKLERHDPIQGATEFGGVSVKDHFSGSPVVAVPSDTDVDGLVAEYTGEHDIQYQDPAVLAVLASPPYFKDVAAYDDNDMLVYLNTEYGTSTGTSSGYETNFECQLGVLTNGKIGSGAVYGIVNAGAGYARSETWGWEKEREFKMSYGTEGGEDAVVMYSVPTENYVYKVKGVTVDDDGNTEEFTNTMVITKPHNPVTQTLTLDDYNEIQKRYSGKLPDVSKYLTSTPGDPSSYPSSEKDLSDEALAHIDKDTENPVDCGEKWAGVSFGSGSITQELSYSKTTRDRYKNHQDGGWCSVGGGVGNETNAILFFESLEAVLNFESSRVEGATNATLEGGDCSGTIKNMPRSAKGYGYDFSWKLLKYNIKDKGCTFPVVSYIVNDVTAPPELPETIQQDFDKTTDSKIALSWTYNQSNPQAFDIYRYEDYPVGGGEKLVGTVDGSDYKIMKDEDGNTLRDKNGHVVRGYTFEEDGLTADTKYQYTMKVRTAKLPGESISSPVIEARTDVGTKPELSLSADELSVYPDGTYNIKVNLADPENYQSDISYQWQKYDTKNRKWEDIDGCEKQILHFYNCSGKDAGTYRCRVNLVRKTEGNPQYISAFTESCDVGFSLRTVQFGQINVFEGEGNSKTNTGLSVNVKNSSGASLEKPTGIVTFTIKGPNGTFRVAGNIDEETGDVTINSIEDRIQDLGQTAFVDGGYVITCSYEGNAIFYPADNDEECDYLRNIDESMFLSLKTAYYFDEDIMGSVKLYDYKTTVGGKTSKTDKTDKISEVRIYAVDDEGTGKTGDPVVTYDIAGGDGEAPVPLSSKLKKKAYVEVFTEDSSEPAAAKIIKLRKVPVEIRINDKTTGTGSLLQFLSGDDVTVSGDVDPNEENIYTDSGKKSMADYLLFRYYEQNGDYICSSDDTGSHTSDFIPASYITSVAFKTGGADPSDFYTPSFKSGGFMVVGSYYLVSAGPDNESAGQVRMTSPDNKVDFTDEGYVGGTKIVLKAEPNPGYEVSKWVVDDCGNKTTYPASEKLIYSVRSQDTAGSGQIKITAVMKNKDNRLTIDKKGEGTVTVSPDTESGDRVMAGTKLKFTAVPADGWKFEEWRWTTLGGDNIVSGGIDNEDGSNTKEFTMPDSSAEVYAMFLKETVDIMVPDGLEVLYVNDGSNPYYSLGELVKTEKGTGVPRGTQVIVRTKAGTVLAPGAAFDVLVTNGEGIVSPEVTNTVSQGREACTFILPGDARTCLVSADTIKGKYSIFAETEGVEFTIKADGTELEGSTADEIEGGSQIDITAKVTERGKKISGWIINGEEKASADTIYTCNITENMSIAVKTEPVDGYDMNVSAEGGGTLQYIIKDSEGEELERKTVTGTADDKVYPGESVLFQTADTDNDHTLSSITINGEKKDLKDGTYSVSNASEDMDVKALFSPNKFYSVTMKKNFKQTLKDGSDCIVCDAQGGMIGDGEALTAGKNTDLYFSVVVPNTCRAYAMIEGESEYLEPYESESYDSDSTRYMFKAENITKDITIRAADHKTCYITTADEMVTYFKELAENNDSQQDAVLMNDIDMSGKSLDQVNNMYACFDGNGHTVSNLTMGTKTDRKYIGSAYVSKSYFDGIFGIIKEDGEIKNVAFKSLKVYGEVEKGGSGTGMLTKDNNGTISNVTIRDSVFDVVHEGTQTGSKVSGFAYFNDSSIEHCIVDGLSIESDQYPGSGFVINNNGSMTGNYITGLELKNSGAGSSGPATGQIIAYESGYSATYSDNYFRQTYEAADSNGINAFTLTEYPEDKEKAEAEENTAAFSRKLAYIMNKKAGTEIFGVSANDVSDKNIYLLSDDGEYKAPVKAEYVYGGKEAADYVVPGTVKLADSEAFGDDTPGAWEMDGKAYAPGAYAAIKSDARLTGLDSTELKDYTATLSELTNTGAVLPDTTVYYKDINNAISDLNERSTPSSKYEIGIIGNVRLAGNELNIQTYIRLEVKDGGVLTIANGLQINNYGQITVDSGGTVHKYGSIMNESAFIIRDGATFYNYGSALIDKRSISGRNNIICKPHVYGDWKSADAPDEDGKWAMISKCSVCEHEKTSYVQPNPDQSKIKSMQIANEPSKTAYQQGEEFTTEGMLVAATLNDAAKAVITDFTMTVRIGDGEEKEIKERDELNETGDGRVTVKYGDLSAGFDITVASHEHSWDEGEITTEPSCETPGIRTHKCTKTSCDAVWEEEISATGHDWGEWEVITPATVSAEGEERQICANDESHIQTRQIEKVSVSGLEELIESAGNARNGVKISDDGKDVSDSNVWTTQYEMDRLNNAILKALTVMSNAGSGSNDIKAAETALGDAVKRFNAAKMPGTKDSDEKTEEEIRIENLNKAKAAAKASLDSFMSPEDFREDERKEFLETLSYWNDEIEKADTINEVVFALAAGKADISLIKTDAQLTEEEQLADAKDSAKTELENYKDPDDYRDAEKEQLEAAVSAGKECIDKADTLESVQQALADAKDMIDGLDLKTKAEEEYIENTELATVKIAAIKELNGYKNESDYRQAEKEKLKEVISRWQEVINNVKIDSYYTLQDAKDAVAAALSDAKDAVDGLNLKTDEELTAEELAAAKENAIAELETYRSEDLYRDADKEKLRTAVAEGIERINEAETTGQAEFALAVGKIEIDSINTAAQLDEADLRKAKKEAIIALKEYKDEADYRQAEKQELKRVIAEATEKINAVEIGEGSIEEAIDAVNKALSEAKSNLDMIKTSAMYDQEKSAADQAAAAAVAAKITALPADPKASDEAKIKDARAAYDALTADQKRLVSEEVLSKLIKAETLLGIARENEFKNVTPQKTDVTNNKVNSTKKKTVIVKKAANKAKVVIPAKINVTTQKTGGTIYKVKSAKKKTVIVIKAANKAKVVIPAKIKVKGKKYRVIGIKAKAFAESRAKRIIVKTKYLTKKSVKGSLKKSKVKVIKVKVGKKKVNKKYVKKYKKIFKKKNCGKKVSVKK